MLEKFFSFKGRLNRKPYWLRSLLILVIFIVVPAVLVGGATGFAGSINDFGTGTTVVFGIVGLVAIILYVSLISIAVRRLHDRDRSGWWVLAYFLVSGVLSGVQPTVSTSILFLTISSIISIGIAIWFLVELGFLRGTSGPNRFGPDPLGGGAVDAEFFE